MTDQTKSQRILLLATLLLCSVLTVVDNDAFAQQSPVGSVRSNDDVAMEILSRVPAFSLDDHCGEPVGSAELYGRVWVANFMFSRCEQACSVPMAVMDGLSRALKQEDFGKSVHFVSITADPDFDTPSVLANYINDWRHDTSQWHFLTGERERIQSLHDNGFKLSSTRRAQDVSTAIPYSSEFVLIDWEGRIRGYYTVRTQADLNALKNDLVRVVDERTVVPASIANGPIVDPRAKHQRELATTLSVFHDFGFADELEQSGITFRHKIIDDVGITYKAVHYDHGNAIAAADVDLDGLPDIYFTTLAGTNELWRNRGDGRFENVTKVAGLDVHDRIGMGASFADIDNDGDPDLYITSVRVGNQLFENDGKGRFTDITDAPGTGVKAHSSTGTFFDYDRDGLLDLFVTNVGKYTTEELVRSSM